jgi:peptidyl-prolyl cis-trans isomerase D
MLDYMRKNQSSVVIKVVFGVLTLVMIGFGVQYSGVRANHTEAVAEVNRESISRLQLQKSVSRMLDAYRRQGISAEMLKALKFKDQALDDLVRVSLLKQEAQRLGLEVTDDEVRDAILTIPAFQQNGRFDMDLYARVLRSNGMSTPDFEEAQREDLLVRKLQELLLSGVYVSDAEVQQQFDYDNEQVALRFVQIKAADLEGQSEVSDEQVQAFYDANKERFREPEKVRAEIVTYAPSAFLDKVTVEDDEVQAYFTDHASEYQDKTIDDVRGEIQVTLRGNKAIGEARRAGEEGHEKAKEGQGLAAAAQASGGAYASVGPLTRGEPIPGAGRVPELVRELFSAEVGQLGNVVETDTNTYVVQVMEKIPARIPELNEIRDQVRTEARRDVASKKAKERAGALLAKLQGGESLEAAAAADSLQVKETETFRRLDSVIPGLGSQADLRSDAFKLTAAKPVAPQVYDVDGDAVVAVFKEHVAADASHLADQKETIKSQIEDRRKRMVMEDYIKSLRERSVIRINPEAVDRVYLS